MSERPTVDVVLPFRGSDEQLERVAEQLARLDLRRGDTVTIADNRAGAAGAQRGAVAIIAAGERQTSYHARNRGTARGQAPWLVFLDADVLPPSDLLERYFATPPADHVGILAGAVIDAPAPEGDTATAAERYAWLKSSMSQEITLASDEWAFAQTANAGVRRAAFEQVGGFEEGVRSGGDADLCFRIRAAGWTLERREDAAVVHRNRSTIPRMLAQRARHGAGAAWLAKRWPGALPRRRWPGLAWWSARRAVTGMLAALRRDRDAVLLGLLDGPAVWAFELGRLIPNRPRPRPRLRRLSNLRRLAGLRVPRGPQRR
ncbi:MAG TPA: glycosyltransferase family 2 protein [Solirubrobacteraceae bacterium]|nr:glycosyltransferase family 2 protein [Solirubrobacteraceae bacterium]